MIRVRVLLQVTGRMYGLNEIEIYIVSFRDKNFINYIDILIRF